MRCVCQVSNLSLVRMMFLVKIPLDLWLLTKKSSQLKRWHSDWLTAVQLFFCKLSGKKSYFSAKKVNSVQFTHRILAFGWPLNKAVWSEPTKLYVLVVWNLLACFGGMNARAPLQTATCIVILLCTLLKNNRTTFFVQFGNNLPFICFSKSSNCIRLTGSYNFNTFWKTHTSKLFPNWTRKVVW